MSGPASPVPWTPRLLPPQRDPCVCPQSGSLTSLLPCPRAALGRTVPPGPHGNCSCQSHNDLPPLSILRPGFTDPAAPLNSWSTPSSPGHVPRLPRHPPPLALDPRPSPSFSSPGRRLPRAGRRVTQGSASASSPRCLQGEPPDRCQLHGDTSPENLSSLDDDLFPTGSHPDLRGHQFLVHVWVWNGLAILFH